MFKNEIISLNVSKTITDAFIPVDIYSSCFEVFSFEFSNISTLFMSLLIYFFNVGKLTKTLKTV